MQTVGCSRPVDVEHCQFLESDWTKDTFISSVFSTMGSNRGNCNISRNGERLAKISASWQRSEMVDCTIRRQLESGECSVQYAVQKHKDWLLVLLMVRISNCHANELLMDFCSQGPTTRYSSNIFLLCSEINSLTGVRAKRKINGVTVLNNQLTLSRKSIWRLLYK